MRNKLLWISFYTGVFIWFFSVLFIDSVSLLPALICMAASIYLALFVAVNEKQFN